MRRQRGGNWKLSRVRRCRRRSLWDWHWGKIVRFDLLDPFRSPTWQLHEARRRRPKLPSVVTSLLFVVSLASCYLHRCSRSPIISCLFRAAWRFDRSLFRSHSLVYLRQATFTRLRLQLRLHVELFTAHRFEVLAFSCPKSIRSGGTACSLLPPRVCFDAQIGSDADDSFLRV